MNTVEELRQKHNCLIWRTAEGEYVPITLMGERHLRNSYKLILRRIAANVTPWALPTPNGEMAGDMWDDYLAGQADEDHALATRRLQNAKSAFEAEFKRRGMEADA